MKAMRKNPGRRLCVFLALLLFLLPAGCGKESREEPLRIGGLKGPTSMGMVKLLADADSGTAASGYAFTLAGTADELTAMLLKGELDVIACPANLAAILNRNTDGALQMLAVNTLGVLYIVENGSDTLRSFSDLKGKTLYATGKNTVPECALRYLLRANGLDPDRDVTVVFKSEPAEVVALMTVEESSLAMLPQPYVAAARSQLPGMRIAVDLTEEWEKTGNGSKLLTGVLAVRRDYAREHPEKLRAFLKEYAGSVDWVNENVGEAAVLVEQYGIVNARVAEEALPYCNIVCLTGTEMKSAADGYFRVLWEENPAFVGGEMPDGAFYVIYDGE